MQAFFPLLQLILVGIIVVWDVVLTGRIAQVRTLPRPFVLLTALAGFLLLPALLSLLAGSLGIIGSLIGLYGLGVTIATLIARLRI